MRKTAEVIVIHAVRQNFRGEGLSVREASNPDRKVGVFIDALTDELNLGVPRTRKYTAIWYLDENGTHRVYSGGIERLAGGNYPLCIFPLSWVGKKVSREVIPGKHVLGALAPKGVEE